MRHSIDSDLILRQARAIQRLELDASRAAELAVELDDLIDSVFAASAAAAFEDDPSGFASLLCALRDAES